MPPLFHDPTRLRDFAFRVIRNIYGLPDTTEQNLDSIIRRVQTIHAGLNPEKEFFSLVWWLGCCNGIYAIEDVPPPVQGSDGDLRPSDFLAVCHYKGKNLPVLIEVKTDKNDELVWSEAYLGPRRRLAQLLQLPFLIAWKRNGIWALTDTELFQKRVTAYHLHYEIALQENLMSLLFGDVTVVLMEDFQFFAEARVHEPLPAEGLVPPGEYTFKILEAGFSVGGKKVGRLPSEQVWLFMASPADNDVERIGPDSVRIILHPAAESAFPLFHVLLAQVAWPKPDGSETDWNTEIVKGPFPSTGSRFREALQEGLGLGTVRYVLEQVPQTIPQFLATLA
ncbi:MAG: hypothetical protein ABSF45_03240 [Terriglobia bacterium]